MNNALADSNGTDIEAAPPVVMRRHDHNSPDRSQKVAKGGSGARAEVSDHGSKTMSTVAMVLAGVALGAILIAVPLVLVLIDARVREGNAEVHASVQQQFTDGLITLEKEMAASAATSQAGKEHARIALDEVQRTNALLEAKGYIQPKAH